MVEDLFHVVLMSLKNLKLTLEESSLKLNLSQRLTTKSLFLDGENKMELNIGLQETHGEHIGEKMDSSESKCTNTTLVSKLIVVGEIQLPIVKKS